MKKHPHEHQQHEHEHFLILIGQATSQQRAAVVAYLNTMTCTWFNYTTDAWIVCTTNKGLDLHSGLTLLLGTAAYHMVMKVEASATVGGMLPPDAWKWLRQHDLVGV